mmetsp:Transcript_115709/g.248616  ORF Transcript_115709/g.248616 Transcript_115709/m.248616 type:complete len:225 (+) Transcript_115709:172-846(+)
MISSTLKIISAASAALTNTCNLLLYASRTPSSHMFPISPIFMFSPAELSPAACAARNWVMSSEESYPALSAIMVGSWRRALAKASMARAALPDTVGTCSSMALAIAISMQPPPQMTLVSLIVSVSTQRASCSERSASSSKCEEAPRRMMVQAEPPLQPEKRMRLSSPTVISSMSSHSPRRTNSGLSKVDAISPPVTAARRSMPSKSACSILTTPASVNICSGKL